MARLGRSQPFRPLVKRPDLGPVYFDNASNSAYEAAVSTFNWTHTVGINSNRAIFVSVGIFATGSVSGIQITGGATENMTLVRADENGLYRSEIWKYVAPASGVRTITVTLSASLTAIGGSSSYWNVHQTTPTSADTGANGTATPATATITPGSANNRVFGSVATATATGVTDQIGQAKRFRNEGALGTLSGAESGIVSPGYFYRPLGILIAITKLVTTTARATALQWNNIAGSDSWAVSMIAIQPASSSSVVTRFLALLGIGS